MTLRDQMAADMAAIHADTGFSTAVASTYTPRTGSALSGKMIVITETGSSEQSMPDGMWLIRSATAFVLAADVAMPVEGDTITQSGVTWTVGDRFSTAAGVHELRVMTRERKRLVSEGVEHDRQQGATGRRTGS